MVPVAAAAAVLLQLSPATQRACSELGPSCSSPWQQAQDWQANAVLLAALTRFPQPTFQLPIALSNFMLHFGRRRALATNQPSFDLRGSSADATPNDTPDGTKPQDAAEARATSC